MSVRYLDGLFSLEGRVALVTGGSRGLGAAIAAGFAAAGAQVVAVGRSPAPPSLPGCEYRVCDVTDQESVTTLCAEIYRDQGRLDLLVNAAGITRTSAAPIQGRADFDATLLTNLQAAYGCCTAVAPLMAQSGGGSIINVTSIAGTVAFPRNPGYVAAKGALRMLSRALALDFVEMRIRVNNLAPGYFHTDMTDASYADPVRRAQRANQTMLGRWGQPDEIVGAAIFLAAPASAYVTGQDLVVDGGWTSKGLL